MSALLLLLACAHPAPGRAPEAPLNPDAVTGVADPALARLLSDHWEDGLRRSPLWATRLGDHRYDDRLDEIGPDALAAGRAARDAFLDRARALAPDAPEDQLTLELLVDALETDRRSDVCHEAEWSLSPIRNALLAANELGEGQEVTTPAAAEAWLARAAQLPRFIAEDTTNLRAGVLAGRTPTAESVRRVLTQLDEALARPVEEWAMLRPAREPAADPAFRERATRLVIAEVRPALVAYRAFIADEILPAARPDDRAGIWALPDGRACYAALAERHTSLVRDPDAVHQVGLDELTRIHAEIRELGGKLFGTTDLAAILDRLRSDPALRFGEAEQIEAKARDTLARAQAAVPRAFGRLPKAACEVRRIPDHEAPYTHIAYYWPAVPDGSRPGFYYVNTYRPETRLRFEAEVLAFHESVPGHHLQIALAQELPALPAFRRNLMTNAFLEGWALYTERLADELGLYSGDLDRLGMLSFDTWRASRLVVDTGIHAQGWTRARAEAFMLANTALSPENVRNEVDRYIGWPGQALGYKLGQIELRRLRAEAEAALGPRFHLAAFHDVVLGGGAVTLPVLERRVRAWVATQS